MTYLHDKNIVHARLTSVNIYIELNQRVKISLIDNDEQALAIETTPESLLAPGDNNKQNLGSNLPIKSIRFNLPALTYLSPELIRTIKTSRKHDGLAGSPLIDSAKLSKKSDIFSFGTLLFELFVERFPFASNLPPTCSSNSLNLSPSYHHHQHQQMFLTSSTPLGFATTTLPTQIRNHNINLSAGELIYQIGSGQIGPKNLHCNHQEVGRSNLTLVKHIIAACWLQDPAERPNFAQLSFVDDLCFRLQTNQRPCY